MFVTHHNTFFFQEYNLNLIQNIKKLNCSSSFAGIANLIIAVWMYVYTDTHTCTHTAAIILYFRRVHMNVYLCNRLSIFRTRSIVLSEFSHGAYNIAYRINWYNEWMNVLFCLSNYFFEYMCCQSEHSIS